jgi:hypothetical protein
MSPFPTPEDRANAKTTAMFDAEPATDRQCGHCAKDMSRADVEADDGDGMCQSCRAFVNQLKEWSAIADFLDHQPDSIQRIFEDLIAALEGQMSYADRIPADINEVCRKIRFINGRALLTLERFKTGDANNIRIECRNDFYPSIPEWCIDFSIATPLPVILVAIKAALETQASNL